MIRNFKIVGALMAVVAMTAVMASGAQASFTASAYPATATATSTGDVFDAFGSSVKCTNNTFTGKLTEASTDLRITPKYTNCTGFGLPATVDFTSCYYTFTAPTTPAPSPTTAQVHIKCDTPGDTIDITIFSDSSHKTALCHIKVTEQTATYTLERGTNDVKLTGNVANLVAHQERTSIVCPPETTTSSAIYTIQAGGVTVTREGGGSVTYD
jgi:hypothetical protein